MSRSAHEAHWTHADATVKGRSRGNTGWWVLLVAVAVVIGLAVFGYARWWSFQTVEYQTMQCSAPLTEDSSWSEVQAAGCEPVDVEGLGQVVVYNQLDRSDMSSQREPAAVEGAITRYDDVAVNSPAHYLELDLTSTAQTVVVAEPDNQTVRSAMSSDSSGTQWGTPIGSRGPTSYWLLVTP